MAALFLPGKKSDHNPAFFTVPLFLLGVRFFYLHFFGIVGGTLFMEIRAALSAYIIRRRIIISAV